MIRHPYPWLCALILLPAACSSDGEAGRAAAGNKAAAAANETVAAVEGAAASNGTAQSEIAAATAASADCPYATRNFRAAVQPVQAPNTGHDLDISWESTADAQGRMVEFDIVEQAPLVVAELRPGTMKLPPGSPAWSHAGSVSSHNAANTHAVLRCGGREIARVAIPRP